MDMVADQTESRPGTLAVTQNPSLMEGLYCRTRTYGIPGGAVKEVNASTVRPRRLEDKISPAGVFGYKGNV